MSCAKDGRRNLVSADLAGISRLQLRIMGLPSALKPPAAIHVGTRGCREARGLSIGKPHTTYRSDDRALRLLSSLSAGVLHDFDVDIITRLQAQQKHLTNYERIVLTGLLFGLIEYQCKKSLKILNELNVSHPIV